MIILISINYFGKSEKAKHILDFFLVIFLVPYIYVGKNPKAFAILIFWNLCLVNIHEIDLHNFHGQNTVINRHHTVSIYWK